jgi:hypothetical protein
MAMIVVVNLRPFVGRLLRIRAWPLSKLVLLDLIYIAVVLAEVQASRETSIALFLAICV